MENGSSQKGEIIDIMTPATCKVIAKVPISTRDEINTAVEAAKKVFPGWRRTPPFTRARCLFKLKELMEEERFEELNRIQTMEHGRQMMSQEGRQGWNWECSVFNRNPIVDDGLQLRGHCSRHRRISYQTASRSFWNNTTFQLPIHDAKKYK